ncbi:MAG: hypothetical protein U1D99_08575, partial [Candidatus Omnitrophota bacterium]|nr:hypothetical protein [Candidatus Omnitrophota bacterium]
MNSLPKIKNFNILILAGFLLPLAYWIYLLFNSRMEIRWDSLEYQSLGILIQEKGWKEYFITGPNREPVYPALVALAMAISNGTAMSDVRVLAMIQLSILFVTQVMTLVLLKRLKVHLLVA